MIELMFLGGGLLAITLHLSVVQVARLTAGCGGSFVEETLDFMV